VKDRILSFVILWTLIIAVPALLGTTGIAMLFTVFALATQREIYGLLDKIGSKATIKLGLIAGLIHCIGAFYGHKVGITLAESFAFSVVFVIIAHLFRPVSKRTFSAIGATIFGLTLAPLMLSFFAPIIQTGGITLAVWVIATAKFADVGGLLTGMAIGRHKLAPNLSPKKTWEGVFGGIALSVIIGSGAVVLFPSHFPEALTFFPALFISMACAISGICADLFESAIKREAKIKDSGKLFPGIGGAFDLTDSLLLAAPVASVLFSLLTKA